MDNKKTIEVFGTMPVPKAVLKNCLPAMAAMLMMLVYNLADTFFIGQTHDAYQVAAVSLATPVFLMFMAVGTLFGVGGTSVISRALGEGRTVHARKVSSFCMWGSVIVGLVMSVGMIVCIDPILSVIGASDATWSMAKTYLIIVICSGPAVLISNCFSQVVRAEGESGKAMLGALLGNLINIILDPVMILALGWNIAGAAIATVCGNVFAAGYYIWYLLKKSKLLSVRPKDFTLKENVCSSVLVIGIPAALGSILMSVSQIIINNRMAEYGDMGIAAMGVAMKVVTITGMVCMGLGQGVQPILGYCCGAKMWDRFKAVLKFALVFALILGAVLTGGCYIGVNNIVSAFLTEETAYAYAVQFSRILLTTSFLFGAFYVMTNALQAMGAAKESLFINLSRQGIIFIPALFILQAVMGMTGLVWAQPVADLVSLIIAIALYLRIAKKMMTDSEGSETQDELSEGSMASSYV